MANFPGLLDDGVSLPSPTADSKTNNPSHAGLHDTVNDAIIAAETKLGTGSSTPASNTLLRGTGTGTSAWTQLTSSQLAGALTDETGTGAAVFATTPTLITPKVDTINENTGGNGTTIGGVNIKSGALNTNNAVNTASVTDGAITPAKLFTGTGSTWSWQTWTPTWTNLTAGNGTVTAKYIQIGKIVKYRLKIVFGTTTSVSGAIEFSPPVAPHADYYASPSEGQPVGQVTFNQVGTALYFGECDAITDSSHFRCAAFNASGTYTSKTDTSSTIPFTWGSGHALQVSGSYEAA